MSFGPGYIAKAPANLLLDQYDGAAAAYSLRKLRLGYTGNCLRVRRGSDNVEREIGFDGDVVDTQALEDFANGGDVFVVTWYDQSGNNRDASQSTQAGQPQIVASGSVITDSGEPAIDFDGASFLRKTFASTIPQPCTWIAVARLATNAANDGNFRNIFGSAGSFQQALFQDTGGKWAIAESSTLTDGATDDQRHIHSALFDGSSSLYRIDASQVVNGDAGTGGQDGITIGANQKDIARWKGKQQAIILYSSDKSSEFSSVEKDVNNHYSIY